MSRDDDTFNSKEASLIQDSSPPESTALVEMGLTDKEKTVLKVSFEPLLWSLLNFESTPEPTVHP